MDVTPGDKMYQAMKMLCDAVLGEEPHGLIIGPAAAELRAKRKLMMDVLHMLVAQAMREGVVREVKAARTRLAGARPRDMQDRNAVSKAKDDAVAGKVITEL